ncbi:MAG: MoaD/ThiS family protein [Anaerolineae bacterium]|nr:MoaD/ThiS family protein [Anaerolineae bacterium]
MAVVWIPSLMRDLTGGQARVSAPGRTVAEVLDALEAAYPGVRERLCPGGRLHPSLAVVVDGRRAPLGLFEPVGEESEVQFVPAVSGG